MSQSAFESEFAEIAVPELLDVFGKAVTYTPHSSGFSRSIIAVVTGYQTSRDESSNYKRNQVVAKTFTTTNQNTGIASPAEHDELLHDGHVWRFHRIISQTAASIEIEWTRKTDIRPTR
jgi:hypothetical protein